MSTTGRVLAFITAFAWTIIVMIGWFTDWTTVAERDHLRVLTVTPLQVWALWRIFD